MPEDTHTLIWKSPGCSHGAEPDPSLDIDFFEGPLVEISHYKTTKIMK